MDSSTPRGQKQVCCRCISTEVREAPCQYGTKLLSPGDYPVPRGLSKCGKVEKRSVYERPDSVHRRPTSVLYFFFAHLGRKGRKPNKGNCLRHHPYPSISNPPIPGVYIISQHQNCVCDSDDSRLEARAVVEDPQTWLMGVDQNVPIRSQPYFTGVGMFHLSLSQPPCNSRMRAQKIKLLSKNTLIAVLCLGTMEIRARPHRTSRQLRLCLWRSTSMGAPVKERYEISFQVLVRNSSPIQSTRPVGLHLLMHIFSVHSIDGSASSSVMTADHLSRGPGSYTTMPHTHPLV